MPVRGVAGGNDTIEIRVGSYSRALTPGKSIRMAQVIYNYVKTFIYVLVDFGLAWFVAETIARRCPAFTRDRFPKTAFVLGSLFLFVAGIGRLGWPIQTIKGISSPEVVDGWIFWSLSLSGTFLILLDFFSRRR